MFLARVIGAVWWTVEWPQIEGYPLLLCRPYTLADLGPLPGGVTAAPTHDAVVCADVLGAGVGEDVVIAYGHAARVAISESLGETDKPPFPIDAAVVMIVDGTNIQV